MEYYEVDPPDYGGGDRVPIPRRPGVDHTRQLRYTDLAVTINTNRAATSEIEQRQLKQALADFIEFNLIRPAVLERLIAPEGPGQIYMIDVSRAGVEVGGRMRRIHGHFVMSILHTQRIRLPGMQTRFQNYINRNYPYTNGSNVDITLLNAREKNYAAKNQTIESELFLPMGEEIIF